MKEINDWLKRTYGCNDAGDPHFRVVFSDNQIESRWGHYNEYCGSIFLREFVGVREVPKYPWVKHKWILERWIPPTLAYTHEIPATRNGSYEPVQVFERDGNPVPVTRQILEQIVWNLFNVPLPGHSAAQYKDQDQKEFEREVELNRLHLEEVGSPLKKDGEAII